MVTYPAGLVQGNVMQTRYAKHFPIDRHNIPRGDFHAQFDDGLAIDGNAAFLDELFGGAAAAQPGGGDALVETFGFQDARLLERDVVYNVGQRERERARVRGQGLSHHTLVSRHNRTFVPPDLRTAGPNGMEVFE